MAINPVETPPIETPHPGPKLDHRLLGDLLVERGRLTQHDVRRVLALQRKKGMRFGEAARALGVATDEEVREALARQFSYPYMRRGESGLSPMLVSAYQPFGAGAESFRMLRSQLMLRWFDLGHKTLAVGSPRKGMGSSTLAANLAVAFAQLGERTLLLDANFRRPAQHSLFGMNADAGLTEVLLGRCNVEKAVVSIAQLNGLAVLCAGPLPPNPHELLSSRGLQFLLELAREIFDVVIIDSPPVLEYADAQMIAARAGGFLLVTRRHKSRLAEVEAAKVRLAPSNATIVGAVVNDD